MKFLEKLKPTKGAVYIKGNALPESDHETATGRQLYTVSAIRKAYDAGYAEGVAMERRRIEAAAMEWVQSGGETNLLAAIRGVTP